jgi:integrase
MKIDRCGQAKILTESEIHLLFSQGLQNGHDGALFGICLFTACRIREACTLRTADAYDAQGRVLPKLIIRKGNTKGKLATRTIPDSTISLLVMAIASATFLKRELNHTKPKAFFMRGLSVAKIQATGI